MPIEAVIFDCDGVLIDSEIIACRVAAEFYTQAGYPISTADYIRRFAGRTEEQNAADILAETGLNISGKIDSIDKSTARDAAFKAELKAIQGVDIALHTLKLPKAIASGSSLRRLGVSLGLTELQHHFAPHIYSAEQVPNGKPAPDVFLLAAERLVVPPKNCLVVGDSHHDITGGLAAGMMVYGFTGASHATPELTQRLLDHGAHTVFSRMELLPALVAYENNGHER